MEVNGIHGGRDYVGLAVACSHGQPPGSASFMVTPAEEGRQQVRYEGRPTAHPGNRSWEMMRLLPPVGLKPTEAQAEGLATWELWKILS